MQLVHSKKKFNSTNNSKSTTKRTSKQNKQQQNGNSKIINNKKHKKSNRQIRRQPRASNFRNTRKHKQPEEPTCCICCEHLPKDVSKRGTIATCKHVFCYSCIHHWSEIKPQCPLCKADFDTILYNYDPELDKYEKEIVKKRDLEDDKEINLDCLDHQFFLDEIARLNQTVDVMKNQIRRSVSAFRSNVKFVDPSKHKLERWNTLQDVKNELASMRADFLAFKQFDPHLTLQRLYALQDRVLNEEEEEDPAEEEEEEPDDYEEEYEEYANRYERYRT